MSLTPGQNSEVLREELDIPKFEDAFSMLVFTLRFASERHINARPKFLSLMDTSTSIINHSPLPAVVKTKLRIDFSLEVNNLSSLISDDNFQNEMRLLCLEEKGDVKDLDLVFSYVNTLLDYDESGDVDFSKYVQHLSDKIALLYPSHIAENYKYLLFSFLRKEIKLSTFVDNKGRGNPEFLLLEPDVILEKFFDYYIEFLKTSKSNTEAETKQAHDNRQMHYRVRRDGEQNPSFGSLDEKKEVFSTIAPRGTLALRALFDFAKRENLSQTSEYNVNQILSLLWPKGVRVPLQTCFDDVDFFTPISLLSDNDFKFFASELELKFLSLFHSDVDFFNTFTQSEEERPSIEQQLLEEEKINDLFLSISGKRVRLRNCLDLATSLSDKEVRSNFLSNYLRVYFSLQWEEGIPPDLLGSILSMTSDEIHDFVLSDESLTHRGILSVLSAAIGHYGEGFGLECDKIYTEIKEAVTDRLKSKPGEYMKLAVLDKASKQIQKIVSPMPRVKGVREDIFKTDLFREMSDVVGDESPYAYSDDQFLEEYRLDKSRSLEIRGLHLPYWFDSAQFGMISDRRISEAEDMISNYSRSHDTFTKDSELYEALQGDCSTQLIDHYGEQAFLNFLTENVHLYSEGGGTAFDHLAASLDKNGAILTTTEVYKGLLPSLKERGIKVFPGDSLPLYQGDDDSYAEAVMKALEENEDIKYMLVSEISRRGTHFPVEALMQIRDNLRGDKRDIHLILDCCQSFGRFQPRYDGSIPDVIFGSAHKGTDFRNASFLMLSNSFVGHKNHERILPANGTGGDAHITSLLLALDPHRSNYGEEALLISERDKALQILSEKFIRLIRKLKSDNLLPGFRFIFPGSLRDGPDVRVAHGIFECSLKGANRKQINILAQEYGVYIADQYDDPVSDNAFRIAFHPRMNSDAIKMLAYVLVKISEKLTKK